MGSVLDYRLILVGSMLPDLIDKPLGMWLLRDVLSSGRVFGHTLLWGLLLAAVGIYVYFRARRTGLLCLSFGSLTHLCLDAMWLNPTTLLWPLYGWSFERVELSHWLEALLAALRSQPVVYVPEVVGVVILSAFLLSLVQRRKLYAFLRTGAAD